MSLSGECTKQGREATWDFILWYQYSDENTYYKNRPVQVEFVVDKLAHEWVFSEYFGSPIHIFLTKLHSYV